MRRGKEPACLVKAKQQTPRSPLVGEPHAHLLMRGEGSAAKAASKTDHPSPFPPCDLLRKIAAESPLPQGERGALLHRAGPRAPLPLTGLRPNFRTCMRSRKSITRCKAKARRAGRAGRVLPLRRLQSVVRPRAGPRGRGLQFLRHRFRRHRRPGRRKIRRRRKTLPALAAKCGAAIQARRLMSC